jgi:hypothetical protein
MCESAPDLWDEAVLAVISSPPAGPERTCKCGESWSGNCDTYTLFLPVMSTHTHTHSASLISHKPPFKIATRNSQLISQSMVCGLCSVMIPEWDQLGILSWAPLTEL